MCWWHQLSDGPLAVSRKPLIMMFAPDFENFQLYLPVQKSPWSIGWILHSCSASLFMSFPSCITKLGIVAKCC